MENLFIKLNPSLTAGMAIKIGKLKKKHDTQILYFFFIDQIHGSLSNDEKNDSGGD